MWLRLVELKALGLPGLPATERGLLIKAKREDWVRRRRQAKGGGFEYSPHSLPKEAQKELFGWHHDIIARLAAEGSVTDKRRLDARLWILVVVQAWHRAQGDGMNNIEARFAILYNSGVIEAPDWVRNHIKTLSSQTLAKWRKAKRSGDMDGLAGQYGNRQGTSLLDRDDMPTKIAALVVHNRHYTVEHIRNKIIHDNPGMDFPSVCAFRRWIRRWKRENMNNHLFMTNPDAWKSRARLAGGNMYRDIIRPNQLWEIDASPSDVMTVDGRHNLYLCVDIYTRRLICHVTKTPRSDAVLLLLRQAVRQWGVPEVIRTDNGKDFVAKATKQAMAVLGIEQDITMPFAPDQKACVERHFRTLQHSFMPLCPGFIGHNVADRQAIRSKVTFAKRLGEKPDKAAMVDMSAGDLQAAIDQWLLGVYEHREHQGLAGKTPFAVANTWPGTIRQVKNDDALNLLLTPVPDNNGYRIFTKQGIRIAGARFYSNAHRSGERVFCRHDPSDMGKIYLFEDECGEFLGEAVCPEALGVDPAKAVMAAKRAQAKRTREEVDPLRREIRSIKPRDMVDAALAQGRNQSGNLVSFPTKTQRHSTSGLDAAADAVELHQPNREQVEDQNSERQKQRRRYRRAKDIQTQLATGLAVPMSDKDWLAGYETLPEYRTMEAMAKWDRQGQEIAHG